MKRKNILYTLAILVALPVSWAGAQQQTHAEHGSQPMVQMHSEQDAMQMNEASIMLGDETVDGVKAMAHVNDIGVMMTQMGRKENYHFMLMFSDTASGAPVESGAVAVKIIDPKTGQAGEAIPLIGMGGHFGADIILPEKGNYSFQVGTKLTDGKKRQYTFHFKR